MTEEIERKEREVTVNTAGYAVVRDSKNWPTAYLVEFGGVPASYFTQTFEGFAAGDTIQMGGDYYFCDLPPGTIVTAIYELPYKFRKRTVEVNKCGYIVITQTKNFPFDLLRAVEEVEIDATDWNKFPRYTGTARCRDVSEDKKTKQFSIGFQQMWRPNFVCGDSLWYYLDTELAGTKINLYYL